jgi:hypothetical protein
LAAKKQGLCPRSATEYDRAQEMLIYPGQGPPFSVGRPAEGRCVKAEYKKYNPGFKQVHAARIHAGRESTLSAQNQPFLLDTSRRVDGTQRA